VVASVVGSIPLLGSIGPLTVGSAAVPCAAVGFADALEALVKIRRTTVDSVITATAAMRAGLAKLEPFIGHPLTGAFQHTSTSPH
jgi:hypothetical protein